MKRSVCAALAVALLALGACDAEPAPAPLPEPPVSVLERPDAAKMLSRTCVLAEEARTWLGVEVDEPVTVELRPMSEMVALSESIEVDGALLGPCDIEDRTVMVPPSRDWVVWASRTTADGVRLTAGTQFATATNQEVQLIGAVELTGDGRRERFWWVWSEALSHSLIPHRLLDLVLPSATPAPGATA